MWLKELRMNCSPDIKIFLVGNNCELEEKRKVSKKVVENFAKEFKIDFFTEVSSKTGLNLKETFLEAALMLYNDYIEYKKSNIEMERVKIKLDENKFEDNESEPRKRKGKKKCL